jgi:hypothetical protein
LVAARQFLVALCIPQETPNVPRVIREEARRLLKHFPVSWDWKDIVEDEAAMGSALELEDYYRNS